MTFRRITIIGLGLIGGSIALTVRKRLSDCQITACDLNPSSLQDALSSGAVNRIVSSAGLACEDADCVILCVPVGGIAAILAQIAPHLKPDVCITDVGSTKQTIVAAARRLLPAGGHFVGSHPMAGGERQGFLAARADLFDGAICIITPDKEIDVQSLEKVEQFWRQLGMEIRRMPADEHDRLVAQVSHLPHVLASALMNAVNEAALPLAGPGFRDGTRVAAGDAALWEGILLDNADQVRASLHRFRAELDRLEHLLSVDQGDALRSWLDQAAARRRNW